MNRQGTGEPGVGEVKQSEVGDLANRFLQACAQHRILAATAESCTGGLIIAAMTDIPGSSSMVDRGFVTYSNDAKIEMLGVATATLDALGAVSAQTAQEMAEGALARSHAGIALAVTGIAGPDGGSAPFKIDPARKEKLLKGLDDIGLTMVKDPSISTFERKAEAARPWV